MREIKGRAAKRRFKSLAKHITPVEGSERGSFGGWVPADLPDEHIDDFMWSALQNKLEPIDAMAALTKAQRKKAGREGGLAVGYYLEGPVLAAAIAIWNSECLDMPTMADAALHTFNALDSREGDYQKCREWLAFLDWIYEEENARKDERIIAMMLRSMEAATL